MLFRKVFAKTKPFLKLKAIVFSKSKEISNNNFVRSFYNFERHSPILKPQTSDLKPQTSNLKICRASDLPVNFSWWAVHKPQH